MGEQITEYNIESAKFDSQSKEAKAINDRLLAGMHVDSNGNWTGPIEEDTSGFAEMTKLHVQQNMMDDQALMVGYDEERKQEMIQADLDQKAALLLQAEADIDFNVAKKTIMEYTRNDNIRAKAAEQFAEFMKYIAAANVIPGAQDYANLRDLIEAIGKGISDPDYYLDTIPDGSEDYRNP